MDSPMKAVTKSIYGNVALLKDFCPICKTYSFVVDGEYSCCGLSHDDIPLGEVKKRESLGAGSRKHYSSQKLRKKLLGEQNNKCIYCGMDFSEPAWVDGRSVKLRIHLDHFIAWDYSQDNSRSNMVATCHLCNQIKSDLYFADLISARNFILERRQKKLIQPVMAERGQ
jgi:5-methylcytosine-specific restriction endonuclease McrA